MEKKVIIMSVVCTEESKTTQRERVIESLYSSDTELCNELEPKVGEREPSLMKLCKKGRASKGCPNPKTENTSTHTHTGVHTHLFRELGDTC